jgi:hypothetical protein
MKKMAEEQSCQACATGGPYHPHTTCDTCPVFDISEAIKTGDMTKVKLVRLQNFQRSGGDEDLRFQQLVESNRIRAMHP